VRDGGSRRLVDQPPRGDEQTQIVLGVNFSKTKRRIRKSYYERWMRDPLRIDPQTKMPKYSPDGETTEVTENGRLVGIITNADILKVVLRSKHFEFNA